MLSFVPSGAGRLNQTSLAFTIDISSVLEVAIYPSNLLRSKAC